MSKKAASVVVVSDQKQRRSAFISNIFKLRRSKSKTDSTPKVTDPSLSKSASSTPSPTENSGGGRNRPMGKKRFGKVLALVVGIVVLVFALAQITHNSNKKANPNTIPTSNIVIGDTVITPKDIKTFSTQVANYSQKLRVNFGGPSVQVAENDLILNAALKDQAKKHQIKVTQADIDVIATSKYQSYGSKEAYQRYVKSVDIDKITQILNENDAYKAKLNDVVIAKKNLFIVGITYDSPYFNRSKNPAALRAQATKLLQTKFLPLFQKGESETQIAAQTDLNYTGSNTPISNPNLFFTSMPTVAYNYNNCTTATSCFNDAQVGSFASIPGIVSTETKVAGLNKVGQYTNVFTSKAGFIGIIQLTGQTPGAYNSWDQLLRSYKKQYAPKLSIRSITHGSNFVAVIQGLSRHIASFGRAIGSLILPAKAYADSGCSQHDVTISVIASDANTGAGLSGAKVTESRGDSSCPTSGGYYVDDSGQSGHRPNRMTTGSSGTASASDNCFTPVPYLIQIQPPAPSPKTIGSTYYTYTIAFDQATVSSGGTSYTVNNTTDFSNQFGPAASNNPNSDIYKMWAGSIVNNNGGLTVHLYYNVTAYPHTVPNSPAEGKVELLCSAISIQAPNPSTYNGHTLSYDIVLTGADPNTNLDNGLAPSPRDPGDGEHSVVGAPSLFRTLTPNAQFVSASVQEYYSDGTGVHIVASANDVTPQCYQATCTIDNVVGDLPNGEVRSGGPITIYATVTNNSYDGLAMPSVIPPLGNGPPNYGLEVQTNVGTSGEFSVPSEGNQPISFSGTAPSGTSGTISGFAAYVNDFKVSGSCGGNVNYPIYQPPTVNISVACQSTITGSASDPYFPGYPIWVHLYADGDSSSGQDLGTVLANGPGQTYSLNVPSRYQDGQGHTFYAYAKDIYNIEDGGPATASIKGCEAFHIAPGANGAHLLPSPEAATSFGADATDPDDTSITVTYGPNNNSWYGPDLSGSNKNLFPSFPGVPATANYTYTRNGAVVASGSIPSPTATGKFLDASYKPTPLGVTVGPDSAGDIYCLLSSVKPSDGFIQNDGVVLSSTTNPNPDNSAPSCDTVQNRPYFKVYNSGVAAGWSFTTPGAPSCTTPGNGNLVGWNNDSGTNPTSGDFGAGTQLKAMAIGKIIGFASAQTAFGRPPTELSFANTVNNTGGDPNYAPNLGGNFATSNYCLSPNKPSATGSTTVSGPYQVDGPGGMTIATGVNKSIFVNGDAYIAGNITYGTGWTKDTVPSFTLNVTGNIYISRDVTELDGQYIAQPIDAATGGKIYTCAGLVNHYSPMAATSLYDNCKNQLTVYGNFVANQPVMMRTYGSLRDEAPVSGSPGSLGTPGASQPLIWSCGGSTCNPPLPNPNNCVHINQPGEPDGSGGSVNHTWTDNQLCVPDVDGGTIKLGWTHYANSGINDPASDGGDRGELSQNYYQNILKLTNCTSWGTVENPPYNYPAVYTWNDDLLCSNVPVHFYAGDGSQPSSVKHIQGPNELCTTVSEPSDPDGKNIWNSSIICIDKAITGSLPGPSLPPTPPLTCSNGHGIKSSPRATCAAEVFDFSPELYLSKPAVALPNGGTSQYDAITGLPPVL